MKPYAWNWSVIQSHFILLVSDMPSVPYINLHCSLRQKQRPPTVPLSTHAVEEGKNLNLTAYSFRFSIIRVSNPGARLNTERHNQILRTIQVSIYHRNI